MGVSVRLQIVRNHRMRELVSTGLSIQNCPVLSLDRVRMHHTEQDSKLPNPHVESTRSLTVSPVVVVGGAHLALFAVGHLRRQSRRSYGSWYEYAVFARFMQGSRCKGTSMHTATSAASARLPNSFIDFSRRTQVKILIY